MDRSKVNVLTLARFFQGHVGGMEQHEAGSGYLWLAEFWHAGEEEQADKLAEWAEASRTALDAQYDQAKAAYDALRQAVAKPNGQTEAKVGPKVPRHTRAVKAKP